MEQKVVVLVGQNQASLLNACSPHSPKFITLITPLQPAECKYTWDDFSNTNLIVNCGGWSHTMIPGIPRKDVKIITWSGDDLETVERILRELQSE
jgi:hypothetical protein